MPIFKSHRDMPDAYLADSGRIEFKKLHEKLGVEVKGLELSKPLESSSVAEVKAALTCHGLLLFRGQSLHIDHQARFTRYFGEPITHVVEEFNSNKNPIITVLSNVRDDDGTLIGADRSGMQWHTDGSFRLTPPMMTILYGVECPTVGAETEFCSAVAILNSLSKTDQACLADCEGVHDYSFYWKHYQPSRPPLTEETLSKTPPMRHPAIRTHPISGMNGTYFMKCMTPELIGPLSDQGAELIDRVEEAACSDLFRYSHKWANGDVLLWDNCSMMHRATEFDDKFRRVMHRSSIVGERPYFSGLAD